MPPKPARAAAEHDASVPRAGLGAARPGLCAVDFLGFIGAQHPTDHRRRYGARRQPVLRRRRGQARHAGIDAAVPRWRGVRQCVVGARVLADTRDHPDRAIWLPYRRARPHYAQCRPGNCNVRVVDPAAPGRARARALRQCRDRQMAPVRQRQWRGRQSGAHGRRPLHRAVAGGRAVHRLAAHHRWRHRRGGRLCDDGTDRRRD